MPFPHGKITTSEFAVVGDSTVCKQLDEVTLVRFRDHAFVNPSDRPTGTPVEEVEYGWSGGQHIYDGQITAEGNVFADCLHLALRIDTNKVPSSVKKAYTLTDEAAMAKGNPSGFISKAQRKEVKQNVARRLDEEMKSGRHRKSRIVHILWDVAHETVYANVKGSSYDKLAEIFERTTGLRLASKSAGRRAETWCDGQGLKRDFEDIRPTQFAIGPEGDTVLPSYPWASKAACPKDYLGNEFLLWLLWSEHEAASTISTADGAVTIYIDRSLDLGCAYGLTGTEHLKGDGPSRSPEARAGLRSGKVPRRAGLILDHQRTQYSLTLNPETMTFAGLNLPDVEDAESPRVVFEERTASLRDFSRAVDALYNDFLQVRTSPANWDRVTTSIQGWIQEGGR